MNEVTPEKLQELLRMEEMINKDRARGRRNYEKNKESILQSKKEKYRQKHPEVKRRRTEKTDEGES